MKWVKWINVNLDIPVEDALGVEVVNPFEDLQRDGGDVGLLHAGLRIRIRIRIQSGQWIRIRIRNPDPDPEGQKWPTKVEFFFLSSCFELLDGLFWELKASSVIWTFFMEA